MARIRYLEDSELTWWMRLLKRISARKAGLEEPSKALNILAHHKGVLAASMSYMAVLSTWKRLPLRLKRLVHTRVAMRVGCPA